VYNGGMIVRDPKLYDDEMNDNELGGIGAADYDIQEEYGIMTNGNADLGLNLNTDEWGY
tara:strand:+ start:593 stop:769 length:177 start_codon:yes stop_codon:yes gene_type:complete